MDEVVDGFVDEFVNELTPGCLCEGGAGGCCAKVVKMDELNGCAPLGDDG